MISISRRQQVAQIKGAPIYVVTGVALIPLSSQGDAASAILQAKQSFKDLSGKQRSEAQDSDGSEDEGKDIYAGFSEDDHHVSPTLSKPSTPSGLGAEGSSVAEDVIGKRGQYGRFAERWFSSKGWSTERRRTQGMSTEDLAKTQLDAAPAKSTGTADQEPFNEQNIPKSSADSSLNAASEVKQRGEKKSSDPSSTDNITNTLLPKLLRTTKMLLASRSFFFSYDYDITRRVGNQGAKNRDIPLHRAVDPLVCFPPFPLLAIGKTKLMFFIVFLESSHSSAVQGWLPPPICVTPDAGFRWPKSFRGGSRI